VLRRLARVPAGGPAAIAGLVLGALLAFVVIAAPQGPSLTEVQRLQIQNLTQRLELAQLRAQAAQHDFDEARAALTTLLKSLEVDGYDLDVGTLTYRKKPDPPKGP